MNTENNKIIAEFMGAKTLTVDEFKAILKDNRDNGFIHTPNAEIDEDLKYHSDWNWLMEVVEKIESLGYDVFINTCVCRITDVGQDVLEDIETFNYENKIQAVYNACVEFIKWYNEQKINP